MPTRRYALTRGEPKRLEVSWTFGWRTVAVRLDGNPIGSISSKEELKAGQRFVLSDGTSLSVRLFQNLWTGAQLHVLRDGRRVPGSQADPFMRLRGAYIAIFLVSGLSIALGVVLLALLQSLPLEYQDVAIGSIIGGLVFALLGFFVRRRSTIALGIAVALFTLDGLGLLFTGSLAGIPLHIVLLIAMIRGFSAIREIRNAGVTR